MGIKKKTIWLKFTKKAFLESSNERIRDINEHNPYKQTMILLEIGKCKKIIEYPKKDKLFWVIKKIIASKGNT